MRKFAIQAVALFFIGFFLPVESAWAQSRGQGVGALAGTTSGTTGITISSGRTAPWAEVIVETASGELVAVAEIDAEGLFSFSFNTATGNVGNLKIYAVDEVGVTENISLGGTTLSNFILPPTIIGNTTTLPDTSIGLEGFSFRGASVTVFLTSSWGYAETFIANADGTTGRWSLIVDNLAGGDYTAWAVANYSGVTSEKSQNITFTIAGPTPTPSGGGFIQDIASGSAQLVDTIIDVATDIVTAIGENAKENADTGSKVLVPVTAAGILWYAGILPFLLSFDYLLTGLRILLGFFIPMKKKKNRWGIIYDALTKRPLRGVIVRLYKSGGDLVETEATGKTGIFSFLPGEGRYEIKASLPGFTFPSKIVTGTEDGEYGSVYHGNMFTVNAQNPVVNLSIPLDPKGYTGIVVVSFMKTALKRFAWYANVGLYIVGLAFSIISYVANPIIYNTVVLIFYAGTLLYLAYTMYGNRVKWGIVREVSGRPAPGIALSLLDSIFRRLVQRRVSDSYGRYQFVVPRGGYYMLVSSPDWELASHANGYDGRVLDVKKNIGIVKQKVIVKKKELTGIGMAA